MTEGVRERAGGAGPAVLTGLHWRCDDVAVRLRRAMTEAAGAAAVAIYAVGAGGAVGLVGSAGLPQQVTVGWRRVPPFAGFPPVAVVRSGRPLWLPELAAARARYTLIGEPDTVWPAQAWLPIRAGGRTLGAVGIYWSAPATLAPAVRRAVTERVGELAAGLVELLAHRPTGSQWPARAQALLDLLPGSLAALEPILDADGEVVDWTVVAASGEAVNAAGQRGSQLVGGRVFEDYPALSDGLVAKTYREVLSTGRSAHIGPYAHRGERPGEQGETVFSVGVHRFGAGLLVTWVMHDDATRAAIRLADTERLGNIGYGTWDLRTGEVMWSDQLYAITGRDRGTGPADLDQFLAAVADEDAGALREAIDVMLERGDRLDTTVRYQTPGRDVCHLRIRCEVVPDSGGRPIKVYGVMQDVSAAKAAEDDRRRLAEARRELADRERVLHTEHRLVAALQQVILPVPATAIERPGLRVGVRYVPAEAAARVGGDWFDVIALPGGDTLLAVGDVAGHGIAAAGTMAKVRHALAALAVTTRDPAELLAYLNNLVHDDPAMPTVTAVVARYQPATGTVTWAQAGHPNPLLIAAGAAVPLQRPAGVLLGALRDTAYGVATARLTADRTLLLYTDGLVERRGPAGGGRWLDPLSGMDGAADLDALLDGLHLTNPDDDTCVLAARPTPLVAAVDHDGVGAPRSSVVTAF